MGSKTVLYSKHQAMGAKLVDFGGWDMPIHYGSQVEEHHAVRNAAGMFDVSHMTVVDVKGGDARLFLQHLLANDVARLKTSGKALYSAMLDESGGVLDDLIAYVMGAPDSAGEWYRLVVNCATRKKDLAWMAQQAVRFDVDLTERPELAMIAIQGPDAIERVCQVVSETKTALIRALAPFSGDGVGGWFIARTGYTGEDGLEIMLPEDEAAAFWQALADAGVAPCGLGARDTLRLEAGMNLYGNDMDESVSPLVANMAWTVAWEPAERDFIGRRALETQRQQGVSDKLVGLVLEGRGVLRAGQKVLLGSDGEGVVTSGTFSPTLGHSIALARVPVSVGEHCDVEMRGKRIAVAVTKPCFVRHGKKVYS